MAKSLRPGRLTCRLHLFHRWRTRSNEFNERWQECLDCGKERGVPHWFAAGG